MQKIHTLASVCSARRASPLAIITLMIIFFNRLESLSQAQKLTKHHNEVQLNMEDWKKTNDTVMKDNRNKWLILLRHKVSFSNLSNSQILGLSTSSLHQQYNIPMCLKQPLLSPHPWHLPLSIKIGDYEKSSSQRLLVHNHQIPFMSINGVKLLHIRLG